MSILINKDTPVIVQGITGNQGKFFADLMVKYGTRITGGIDYKGKNIDSLEFGDKKIPVYNNLESALKEVPAELSILFIPAAIPKHNVYVREAIDEALDEDYKGNTIKTSIIISEFVPQKESAILSDKAKKLNKILIGPNCPGIITPAEAYVGVIPAFAGYFAPGDKEREIGLISGSGTLCYEVSKWISDAGLALSTAVSTGGDAIKFSDYVDYLKLFRDDPKTNAVVLIGEIGGTQEQEAARYIKESGYEKPVFAFVAGKTAPEGKRMGHAGAVIEGSQGKWDNKIAAFEDAGVQIFGNNHELEQLLNNYKNK